MRFSSLFAAVLCSGLMVACAETKPFAQPILLTSCGQCADALMMKTLLSRDSLAFSYLPTATAADLDGKGSLMLVVGGSSKGLGAAKISADDETARVTALLDAAEKAEIPIIAVHMGGLARRGALSDPFNRLGAEHAHRLIVVKGGDNDSLFTKIAEDNSILLETADTALGVSPLVKKIYHNE
jgi:hypothetical protein